MRPMRRQDRAVTDPEKIAAVLDACPVCRLGFCDQGRPYVVPVNFGHAVEDGRHVFGMDRQMMEKVSWRFRSNNWPHRRQKTVPMRCFCLSVRIPVMRWHSWDLR